MSFSHFYPLHNPRAIFTKCPQCETSLVVDSPNDYGICSCSECYIHFCYRCFAEPHWPMSCGEFPQWSQKWEEQYPIEKLCLDEDENVLRINCVCGSAFFVAESSAHGTYCPNKSCGHRYDKAGLMRSKRDLWFWYTARDRQKRIEGRDGEMGKDGIPIVAECISQKRMIRKEFCAEARNMRYDRSKRRKFKELVVEIASSREEQIALLDTRVTALLLVEHCTAWLYLHRSNFSTRGLKSLTSKLLEDVKNVESKIGAEKSMLIAAMEELRKHLHHFISTFQKASVVEEEAEPDTVIAT
ncbi:hypothetical protein OESDEN_11250 [Oesophagostomum dentatum]|uniref:IBR domain protein n=1 Tax=Oesophagostomum dentatum TaxID=61180 RepID=A0A0B1SVF0_OESDE|nr:hypothetical protein OESDEN_11250 [Oesophagostomum dentatum]